MEKKRSRRNDSDEENKENRLEKRLRRLERREKKRKRERRRKRRHARSSSDYSSSSEASSRSGSRSKSRSRSRSRSASRVRTQSRDKSPERISEAPMDADAALTANTDISQKQVNTITTPAAAVDASKNPESDIPKQVIDEKALEVLGKHLTINKPAGPPVCEELVSRWSEILAVGLLKEDRAALLLKYGTPANCPAVNPPKLNPEVKASLTEPVTSRDAPLVAKQDKVTVCISALGAVLSKLLCGETVERLALIEVLSGSEKLLVDLQREQSMTRKALIVSNLNISIKDALNATSIDEWLSGQQLNENIKTAKTLERSSKQIKAVTKGSTITPQKTSRARSKNAASNNGDHRGAGRRSRTHRGAHQVIANPSRRTTSIRWRKKRQ